jgi:hypothetical protein
VPYHFLFENETVLVALNQDHGGLIEQLGISLKQRAGRGNAHNSHARPVSGMSVKARQMPYGQNAVDEYQLTARPHPQIQPTPQTRHSRSTMCQTMAIPRSALLR